MSIAKDDLAERLEELRLKYQSTLFAASDELTTYLQALRAEQLSPELREELRRSAHQITGSAGSYGYDEISVTARKVERASAANADTDDAHLASSLSSLIEQITNLGEKPPARPVLAEAPQQSMNAEAKTRAKVLIAEDDPLVANLLKSMMDREADVILTANGAETSTIAEEERPDLIILDDDLPGLSGVEVVKVIRGMNSLQHIPIVMLTGNNDPRNVIDAVNSGANDYFTKPFEPVIFVNHIRELLSRKDHWILLVDDDAAVRELLRYRFEAQGIRIVQAKDGIEALSILDEGTPDLVILDRMMPGLEGAAVLHELRQWPELKQVPVIMLTARSGADDAHLWLKRGAVDFMTKPFNPDEVVLRSLRVLQLDADV